jgi:hypothetical protein
MHIADKMSVDLCYVDRRVHEPTGDRGLFRRREWDVRRQLEVPGLKTVRMTTGQAKPPLRPPDFEGEASILRRYAAADVGREYGTRTRLTQDVM